MEIEEGTKILIEDLKAIIREAEEGEFGDFTNNKYAAPKIALVEKLIEIQNNTKNGKYD